MPDELKPGPEMDAKVAECLGWRKSCISPGKLWFHPGRGCRPLPPLSTDDGVAFQNLWLWLIEKGGEVKLVSTKLRGAARWHNVFLDGDARPCAAGAAISKVLCGAVLKLAGKE
ncbi:MAG: hypothetical protein U1E51_06655 [Candidatus Binatia bacterium]|nr:hypothetical protein [Candidatus Binatia bacterium]